jgi:hypothetical protein
MSLMVIFVNFSNSFEANKNFNCKPKKLPQKNILLRNAAHARQTTAHSKEATNNPIKLQVRKEFSVANR